MLFARQRTEWNGENNPHWRGGKVKINCLYCGKEVLKFESQIAQTTFCSKECFDKARTKPKPPKSEHGARWTGDKKCKNCETLLIARKQRRRGTCDECKVKSSKIGGAKRGQLQTLPESFIVWFVVKNLLAKVEQKEKFVI